MKRITLALASAFAIAVATYSAPPPARAQVVVTNVNDPQYLLNEARALTNQLNQLENAAQQLSSLQQQLRTLQQTATTTAQAYSLQQQQAALLQSPVWTNAAQNVQQLEALLSQEHYVVLTNQNAARNFSAMYGGAYNPNQYIGNTNKWYDATSDSYNGVIATANSVLGQQNSDLAALASTEQQINSAAGETTVLQASATIAAQQVEQLNKLVTLQAQEGAAEAQFKQAQAARQQVKDNQNSGFSFWLRGQAPATQPSPASSSQP